MNKTKKLISFDCIQKNVFWRILVEFINELAICLISISSLRWECNKSISLRRFCVIVDLKNVRSAENIFPQYRSSEVT